VSLAEREKNCSSQLANGSLPAAMTTGFFNHQQLRKMKKYSDK
jgi:hypothetical protein